VNPALLDFDSIFFVVSRKSHLPMAKRKHNELGELALAKGDRIMILHEANADFWLGQNDNGDIGFIPSACFQ
jgi:hypothetical protein